MLFCRPFYRKIVYHYQAAGLGGWLEKEARSWEHWVSRLLLGRAALSIALGDYHEDAAFRLEPHKIVTIPNCSPDPCPDYDTQIKPQQQARAEALGRAGTWRVLYLSLCYREKGLFDLVEAVAEVNARLQAKGLAKRVQLDVAGKFYLPEEEAEFTERIGQADLNDGAGSLVVFHGFDEVKKLELLNQADAFSLPSYYSFEAHPACLVEAMAYGLPIVATRWRILPELFPEGYEGLVDIQSPDQIADRLKGSSGGRMRWVARTLLAALYVRRRSVKRFARHYYRWSKSEYRRTTRADTGFCAARGRSLRRLDAVRALVDEAIKTLNLPDDYASPRRSCGAQAQLGEGAR